MRLKKGWLGYWLKCVLHCTTALDQERKLWLARTTEVLARDFFLAGVMQTQVDSGGCLRENIPQTLVPGCPLTAELRLLLTPRPLCLSYNITIISGGLEHEST